MTEKAERLPWEENRANTKDIAKSFKCCGEAVARMDSVVRFLLSRRVAKILNVVKIVTSANTHHENIISWRAMSLINPPSSSCHSCSAFTLHLYLALLLFVERCQGRPHVSE